MSIVSRNRQVQVPLARGTFDNLIMGTALMLNPPARDARLDAPHQALAVLGPLLVLGDFLGGWCYEVVAMNALSRFLAGSDEAWQLVHPAVLGSTVKLGIIDVRFAGFVLSHRAKMDAPIGCETGISRAFLGHLTPSLHLPLRVQSAPPQ
jgi:hypothetical protein